MMLMMMGNKICRARISNNIIEEWNRGMNIKFTRFCKCYPSINHSAAWSHSGSPLATSPLIPLLQTLVRGVGPVHDGRAPITSVNIHDVGASANGRGIRFTGTVFLATEPMYAFTK